MTTMSGFQHAPGTPERRVADRSWIELHKVASVKNPSRYNSDTAHAFGVAHVLGSGGDVELHLRGTHALELYDSIDELLDAGWTVD